MSIAVIGDHTFITAFEFIGAYGFLAADENTVIETLKKLLDEDDKFKIIIISERFSQATLDIRLKIIKSGSLSPLFAILPDIGEVTKGERLKEIESYINHAIGVELK